MRLEQQGDVHVLTLEEGATTVYNADSLAAWAGALDRVEATEGPAALVITGSGKSFHQGLDLPWLMGLGEGFGAFVQEVHQLFGRLLRLELPTVAAVNGHAQAGGAMLVHCLDVAIMRADRGWYRLPEVELGLPFTRVMNDLLQARIPRPAVHRLMVLGERMGGADAAAAGVVDRAVEGEGAALEAAVAHAAALAAHRGPVLAQIRRTLYADLLAVIDADRDQEDRFWQGAPGAGSA